MKRVTYKVEMYFRDKPNFIILGDNVGKRDLEFGDQSPIKDITNMHAFRENIIKAQDLNTLATKQHFDGEKNTELAYVLIGCYKGQDKNTPKTLYSAMNRIMLILKDAYFGKHEELQKFGFNVVQGKKGYNVSLPKRSAYAILDAANKCIARHKELGKDSPLSGYDMKAFEQYGKEATAYINYATKSHDAAEATNEELSDLLGFSKDQNIRTEGTLYYFIGRIRDLLLSLYFGKEKQIEDWGFKIIISTSKKKKEEEEENNS